MRSDTNKTSPQKKYTITNKQMLKFIDKLPTLKENNKNTEFNLSVVTQNDVITETQDTLLKGENMGTTFIHFSYDFVNDRWFLNDKRIEVPDRERG